VAAHVSSTGPPTPLRIVRRGRLRPRVREIGRPAVDAQAGQASVELIAVVPFLLLAGLVAWQLLLAAHSLWLAASAARVAARADVVGRSVESAARSALPEPLERDLSVVRLSEGGARVSVRVPLVLQRWSTPLRVSASASLGGQ
jgi:hypothetical protein